MIMRSIPYINYNGVGVVEDFYFNISRQELAMMEVEQEGSLSSKLKRIIDTKNGSEIMKFFNWFILKAYGEKSEDGRRFEKSEELSKAFSETPAYDELFVELLSDPDKAIQFVESLIPKNLEAVFSRVDGAETPNA